MNVCHCSVLATAARGTDFAQLLRHHCGHYFVALLGLHQKYSCHARTGVSSTMRTWQVSSSAPWLLSFPNGNLPPFVVSICSFLVYDSTPFVFTAFSACGACEYVWGHWVSLVTHFLMMNEQRRGPLGSSFFQASRRSSSTSSSENERSSASSGRASPLLHELPCPPSLLSSSPLIRKPGAVAQYLPAVTQCHPVHRLRTRSILIRSQSPGVCDSASLRVQRRFYSLI